MLISESVEDLQKLLDEWQIALESRGLHISRQKTEYMRCEFSDHPAPCDTVFLEGFPLNEVSSFKYLGSMLSKDGNINANVDHRTNTGWLKWKMLSGVLCNKSMPIRIKGKIYETAVRPAMMYGAECWPLSKHQEQKLHVAEMKMLRWAGGVTMLDKVRNDHIRGTFKIKPIVEKIAESRLRWYGHVMRRPAEHMTREVMEIGTSSRRPGRPRLSWMTLVNNDMRRAQVDDMTTQDRNSS